jgi:phosphopantetheinyl transferase
MRFPLEGKPAFAGPPHFSIAHSAVEACCGLSLDATLGIDVEFLDGVADDEALQAMRRWTAIEATLKAAGKGLRHAEAVSVRPDLSSAAFEGRVYFVRPATLSANSVCHLASTRPLTSETVLVDLASPGVSALLQQLLGLGTQRG